MYLTGHFSAIDLLLVEDNGADVRSVQEDLREAHIQHRLSVVQDGEEAVQFLRRKDAFHTAPRPDLVLLDLNLNLNLTKRPGIEVLCEMEGDEDLKTLPVLIYTSSASRRDVHGPYARGANSCIRKPGSMDEMYGIIRTLEHVWLELALIPSQHFVS